MPHTPGPWFIEQFKYPYTSKEDRVISSRNSNGHMFRIGRAYNIASPVETDANAALIAAAPDLLEALQNLVVWVEHLPGGRSAWEYVNALATLAKAKGA